jgi:RHS repeat-associated protein
VQRFLVGNKENTKFIYDGQDVVADDNFGTLTKYQNGLGIDNKLKVSTGGTAKYFLADHLGSTNALTNSSGAMLEQTAYDSFGNTTTNLSTRYQFTGREYDSFTGLHYYRARFYDANLGRFISEDPIGFEGGDINLFAYVTNNPLRYKDPKGTAIIPILVVGGGLLGEALFHSWLSGRAAQFFPSNEDPLGRKKHCYVNCMSMRFHLFNPMVPTLASVSQEVGNLALASTSKDFSMHAKDSLGDMQANQYGQGISYLIWRSCKSLCEDCPRNLVSNL